MRTICLYFEIHQIIHLKRYRFFDIGTNHYSMMIMPMKQVLMKLPNVRIFLHWIRLLEWWRIRSLHNSSISLSPARFLILTAPTWSASSWYPQLVQQNPFECRFSAFRLLHTGHTWLVKSGSTSKKSHPFWFSASISFLWSFPLANVENIPLTLRLLLNSLISNFSIAVSVSLEMLST